MVTIQKGRLIIYRLYDVAAEIILSRIEQGVREGTRRMRLSKHPYMKALEFTNPPVSFDIQGFTRPLFGEDSPIGIVAKAFDFGVVSLAFSIPIPAGTTFKTLEEVSKWLDTDGFIDQTARDYIEQLVKDLGPAIVSPGIKEEYVEDYMIFFIERLERDIDVREFLREYDPSRLLLYETRDLSEYTREETIKHRFSYYADDLVIVHLDNAFVIEPTGSSDIPDMLEFAIAQILELRYYDHVLDLQVSSIYSELNRRRTVSAYRLRDYEKLAKKITEIVAELTEVTERVDNALKVTEDVYYAKIYRTAMLLLRSSDWEQSIRDKLQVVTNTSKMIYAEISTKRGHLLELGIIILIVVEIVILLAMEW